MMRLPDWGNLMSFDCESIRRMMQLPLAVEQVLLDWNTLIENGGTQAEGSNTPSEENI